jgi:predicted ATPase
MNHTINTKNTKNIYIIGAQSTGKTTLVNALEAYFQSQKKNTNHHDPSSQRQRQQFPKPKIIKEVARTVLTKHAFTAKDITSSKDRCMGLQRLILSAQAEAERGALRELELGSEPNLEPNMEPVAESESISESGSRSGHELAPGLGNGLGHGLGPESISGSGSGHGSGLGHGHGEKWFISDRSGVDPIVYAYQHINAQAAEELMATPEWKELKERMRKGLVVVCEPRVVGEGRESGESAEGVESVDRESVSVSRSWLTDDGVRLMPASLEEWKGFHDLFCRVLEERMGLGFVVLPCGLVGIGERVAFVLERF